MITLAQAKLNTQMIYRQGLVNSGRVHSYWTTYPLMTLLPWDKWRNTHIQVHKADHTADSGFQGHQQRIYPAGS